MKLVPPGIAAYAQTARQLGRAADAPAAAAPAGSAFGTLLRQEAGAALDALRQGEQAAFDGLVGRAGVQDVVTAITQAELGLHKVTAVRDRVIAAYQEIMRMPI
jgi:flagellar hook-basal body complex protein FliE